MTALLEHAAWLPAVVSICFAATIGLWVARIRRRTRVEPLLGRLRITDRSASWRDGLLILALVSIGVGLIGPRVGSLELQPSHDGADIVLLFDLSRSMDAEDTAPSRLDRAISSGRELLDHLAPGDHVALAGFAGRGVLFTPLTPDRGAVRAMLPHLDSQLVRPWGSDLAAGIEAAIEAFETPEDRPRVIAVFSDGEVSDPGGAVGISAAVRANVRVVAVGIGSEAGTSVPNRGAPIRDDDGRIVVSRRFLGTLERLAQGTDGELLAADSWGSVSADRLLSAVDRDTRSRRTANPSTSVAASTPRSIPVLLAWPFAGAAFLTLLGEAIWAPRPPGSGQRKRRTHRGRPHAGHVATGVLLATLILGVRPADSTPAASKDMTERFRVALQHALSGDVDTAGPQFAAVAVLAEDPELVALAEYDLGVLALGRDALEEARDHFLKSLVYAPGNRKTRFNAEWTLRALAARPSAEPAASPEPNRTARPISPESDDRPLDEAGTRTPAGSGKTPATDSTPEPMTAQRASDSATRIEPTLGRAERARWLERISDDPSHAMQITAEGKQGHSSRLRHGMSW